MSDKIYLKEITLPIVETGENETYSFVQTDADLDTAGDAADAKAVGDELTNLKQDYNSLSESKADKTANNPSMGSGYASQLVSSLRKSDSVPYNFRKVPYDSTLEDGSIVGASVAWNQLINANSASDLYSPNATIAASNNTVTLTSSAASGNIVRFGKKNGITSVVGHKVLLSGTVTPSVAGGLRFYNGTSWAVGANTTAGTSVSFSVIFDVGTNGFPQDTPFAFSPSANMSNDTIVWKYPQICDLTQMLGTTIADYVYSLETATAGSGVAWLKEHFPKQFGGEYQAYNAGEIKSISGLSAHKSVGFNAWDEEAEVGHISNTGAEQAYQTIRSKNYCRCVPGATLYGRIGNASATLYLAFYDANKNFILRRDFTNRQNDVPQDAWYFRITTDTAYGTTYNYDICINISKTTGTPKNGDYVPYESHTYALDSTKTLRGILKLDSNNKLYADGDRYLADGKKNERYDEIDLGEQNFSASNALSDSRVVYYFNTSSLDMKMGTADEMIDVICGKYFEQIWENKSGYGTNTMLAFPTASSVGVPAKSFGFVVSTSDYATAAAFKTAMAGVKLVFKKATPTEADAQPYGNPQVINPDGTESYVYNDGAFELPVGHESEYPVNVSGQLDDILDTPTTNGTYTLQATVTDGVVSYEWVSAT